MYRINFITCLLLSWKMSELQFSLIMQIGQESFFYFRFKRWMPGFGEGLCHHSFCEIPWAWKCGWSWELLFCWISCPEIIPPEIRDCSSIAQNSSRWSALPLTIVMDEMFCIPFLWSTSLRFWAFSINLLYALHRNKKGKIQGVAYFCREVWRKKVAFFVVRLTILEGALFLQNGH